MLLISRNHNTKASKRFINWAEEILYTVQMGTTEQRIIHINDQMGRISAKQYAEIIRKVTRPGTDYIYLLKFCNASDRQNVLGSNFGENDIICKWGRGNLYQRLEDHEKTYDNIIMDGGPEVLLHYPVPKDVSSDIEKEFGNVLMDIYLY